VPFVPPFLQRLGLGLEADVRDIRRAYARELKQLDPEADPRGFQALREAYEAALRWVELRAARLGGEDEEEDEGQGQCEDDDERAGSDQSRAPEAPADSEPAPYPGWSRRAAPAESSRPPEPEPGAEHDSAPEAGWPRGRAPAEPPDGPLAAPEELAGFVFKELRAAVERGFHGELDAGEALDRFLADPRLLGIEARHEFEARIAGLLAAGFRPGHEHLFPAATARFEWRTDRRRLGQLGPAGRAIDAALEEELILDGLGAGEASRYRELARKLRDGARPPEVVLVELVPALAVVRVRFPRWLRLVAPAEAIERWQRWWAEIPQARRTPSRPAPPVPSPARKPGRSSWTPAWGVFAVLIALARLAGSGSETRHEVPPPAEVERWLQQGYPRELPPDPGAILNLDPRSNLDPREPACNHGGIEACYRLARAHLPGGDRQLDPHRAGELLRIACDGGWPDACFELGRLLRGGHGLGRDDAEAAARYQMACDRGLMQACVALAALYSEGEGVEKDQRRAAQLLRKACDGGVPGACPPRDPRRPKRAPPPPAFPEHNPAPLELEPSGPTEGTRIE
jgi:hypothetical protein